MAVGFGADLLDWRAIPSERFGLKRARDVYAHLVVSFLGAILDRSDAAYSLSLGLLILLRVSGKTRARYRARYWESQNVDG